MNSLMEELYKNMTASHRNFKSALQRVVIINILILLLFGLSFLISHFGRGTNTQNVNSYLTGVNIFIFIFAIISLGVIGFYYNKYCSRLKLTEVIFTKQLDELIRFKGHFEKILDSIPDAVTLFDHEGKILYSNRAEEEILAQAGIKGYRDKCFFDVLADMGDNNLMTACERVMRNQMKETIESKYLSHDACEIWHEVNIYPLSSGVMLIETDITKKREIEIELNVNEEKYKKIFNQASDSIIILEYQGRTPILVDANEQACALFGYSKEDFLKLELKEIFTDEDSYNQNMAALNDQGMIKCEMVHKHKDGTTIPIEANVKTTEIHGKRMVIAILRNITERINTIKRLNESEENYRNLFELSPNMIFIQQDNRIVMANPATLDYFGVDHFDELTTARINNFLNIDQDYYNKLNEIWVSLLDGSMKYYVGVLNGVDKEGKHLDFELNAYVITYNGTSAIQIIIRDTGERLQLEEVKLKVEESQALLTQTLEYDRLKTEFFSNISHELRTPLNIILGSLQLYDIYKKNDNISAFDNDKYFKIMRQNCNRLLRLINNLIDITRIDTGFYELNLKNCNVISIIEDTTLSVADYIENKGIYIEFETDIEEKTLACDPDKIERIILNLLSNAIKHTNEDGKIYVNIESSEDEICITIKDTGEGIPEDKLGVIFERFRQADKSLTRKTEGSGIGLALVKSLVEMHGGTIAVKSQVNEGSEFIIKLPVRTCEESQDAAVTLYNRNNVERISIEFSDIYKIS